MSKQCSLCRKITENLSKYLHYSDDPLYEFAMEEQFCDTCEKSYFVQSGIRKGIMRKVD